MHARTATLADAAAVAEIGRVAFPPTHAGSLDTAVIDTVVGALYTEEATAAAIAAACRQENSRFLVVQNGDRVDGFLHYDELGPEPELHRIYLRPAAIGTGAGSAAANTRAIDFHRRHGLEVRDSVDGVDYYRVNMGVDIAADAAPHPAYVMARNVR